MSVALRSGLTGACMLLPPMGRLPGQAGAVAVMGGREGAMGRGAVQHCMCGGRAGYSVELARV